MGSRRSILVNLLQLFVSLSCINMIICGVEGFQVSFNGFMSSEALYIVPNSQIRSDSGWQYNSTAGYFYLDTVQTGSAGRILLPEQVQVKDPANNLALKSFSTTFVFQIYIVGISEENGSGIVFIMVPDNSTLGDPQDYMGFMSKNSTSITNANSFGVELDTYMNLEFNDSNSNHIGLDLGSMNSTHILEPTDGFSIATRDIAMYHQVWIDYVAEDSRMDIYYGQHGKGKPDTPQGVWTSVDLSLTLNENMYVGFSAAIGTSRAWNWHRILAWSFSNEGYAPAIYIAEQAPPPVASTSPPPPGASKPPPPPRTSNTPPAPLGTVPSPPGTDVGSDPPPKAHSQLQSSQIVGIVAGCSIIVIFFIIWMLRRVRFLIYLAHTSGNDDTMKNFAVNLAKDLKSSWRYKLKLIDVFFDRDDLPKGQPFPEELLKKLSKTRVGVVIITEDFFERKWCMTELLSFVKSKKRHPEKVRILPLFYRLTVKELKEKHQSGHWDEIWRKMSTEAHPIDVGKCTEAVEELCKTHGDEYNFTTKGFDKEFREIIRKTERKMWYQMVKCSCSLAQF